MNWEQLYDMLGIREFIYFISSPQLQDMLFFVKLVFASFSAFFLVAIIYFMVNSSWIHYKFLEDVAEFVSWKSYGARQITKRWAKIKARTETGIDADLKIAVIDADDFLWEVLEGAGYEGKDFSELIKKAGKTLAPFYDRLVSAHETRNAIVYNPDFKISRQEANTILDDYQTAVNAIGLE